MRNKLIAALFRMARNSEQICVCTLQAINLESDQAIEPRSHLEHSRRLQRDLSGSLRFEARIQMLMFSRCGEVNFVAQSNSPSSGHFLRSFSMSRGQKQWRVFQSRRRIYLERSPKREPHRM